MSRYPISCPPKGTAPAWGMSPRPRTALHIRAVRPLGIMLAICCWLSVVSAQWLEPTVVLPDGRSVTPGNTVAPKPPAPNGLPFKVAIGVLDTIGGTTHDWQTGGPAWRMIVDSRRYGVHATWMYSADMSNSTFPDRNMRYQFYYAGWGWNWPDPDFMQSGVNVFPQRTGYGNIDVDTSGVAVISAHYASGGGLASIVATDADVGAGIFDYSYGDLDGYCWPCIGVDTNNYYHLAMVDYTTQDDLYWSRSTDEGANWETPMFMSSPKLPDHNIAASKVGPKVCITWVVTPASGSSQMPGFYRESPDGGENWDSPVELDYPPAFSPGSDTVPSFHITSLFPFYDSDDRLNIVANVMPYVNDTNYIVPSEIWHYCPDNTPQWNRIHIAGCDPGNMQGSVGLNAAYACRPSIGQDDYGDLFVAWEQFDSANVESTTNRLRADIWAAGSTDGGFTWSTALKLTTPGTASCRFPSICDLLWPGDSLAVLYMADQCAGFFLYGEGPGTSNPIVVHKVPIDSIIQRGPYSGRLKEPNGGEFLVTGDTFAIKWMVTPTTFDHGVLSLSTDGGSTFPTVLRDSIPPAETTYLWDSIPQLCCSLCRVRFEAKDSLGATVLSDMSNGNFTIDTVFVGVSDSRLVPGTEATSEPTVIRGVLMPQVGSRQQTGDRAELLDVSGRKVLDLKPGANDVRALAPGVYFVREAQAKALRKVVLTR